MRRQLSEHNVTSFLDPVEALDHIRVTMPAFDWIIQKPHKIPDLREGIVRALASARNRKA